MLSQGHFNIAILKKNSSSPILLFLSSFSSPPSLASMPSLHFYPPPLPLTALFLSLSLSYSAPLPLPLSTFLSEWVESSMGMWDPRRAGGLRLTKEQYVCKLDDSYRPIRSFFVYGHNSAAACCSLHSSGG